MSRRDRAPRTKHSFGIALRSVPIVNSGVSVGCRDPFTSSSAKKSALFSTAIRTASVNSCSLIAAPWAAILLDLLRCDDDDDMVALATPRKNEKEIADRVCHWQGRLGGPLAHWASRPPRFAEFSCRVRVSARRTSSLSLPSHRLDPRSLFPTHVSTTLRVSSFLFTKKTRRIRLRSSG